MIDINEKKNKIVNFLQVNGPTLPVRISKVIEMEPVFASAILSELYNDKRIKMSHMKIGSSSLFFLPGQEEKLQDFIENLKTIEKEVFFKLKEQKILFDESEDPAIRVAVRGMKDFAIPFEHDGKQCWKFVSVTNEEVENFFHPKEIKEKKKEEVKEKVEEKVEEKEDDKVAEKKEVEKSEKKAEKKIWKSNKVEGVVKPEENEKVLDVFDETKSEFYEEVKKFLKKNDIEIIDEIQADKKEVVAKIVVKSKISDLNYLLIAKNKKSVNREEVNVVLQRSSYHKMPCILILRKEPSKSVMNMLKENGLITLGLMD